MNLEIIKQILIVSIAASIVSTAIIQKIKEQLKSKKWLFFTSLISSIIIGITFALSFTELSIINSIWVGLITWIGADAIYKSFEDKIFKKFSDIEQIIEIKRDDLDE
jgi:Na+/melibiose symporter-like transporter